MKDEPSLRMDIWPQIAGVYTRRAPGFVSPRELHRCIHQVYIAMYISYILHEAKREPSYVRQLSYRKWQHAPPCIDIDSCSPSNPHITQ
jgi:hypothetical protein